MTHCEEFETAVSALVDGELPAAETPAAIDHLLDCPSCRGFYRAVRGLGALLDETGLARGQAPEPAPEAVWRRVERHAGSPLSRLPAWAARAAAAALLAVGAWGALQLGTASMADRGAAPLELVLSENAGSMTDDRFVAIATELLRAAPRYRQEMLEVMTTIESEVGRTDGPTGGDLPRPAEERGGGEAPAGPRLPS